MSEAIVLDIASRLQAVPNCPENLRDTTASLWSRWFTTLGMRVGMSPNQLYQSVDIDIQHSTEIVKQISKEIDVPDALKKNPTLLSLLSNEEVLGYLERAIGKDNSPKPFSNVLNKWLKNSVTVNSTGEPQVYYHGSFADITSFNKDSQDDYSRLGKGFYFTTNAQDASDNYASPESPELQAKAQAIMSHLHKSGSPIKDINYSQIKKGLAEEGGAVYPVYLNVKTPFVISEDTPYHRGQYDKAISFGAIATAIVMDHEGNMDEVEQLNKQLNGASNTVDAINIITRFSQYNGYDGLPLQIIERSGFDGVIDKSAGNLWHTPNDAEHLIVFNANQIKSAIGNIGAYDDSIDNILYQDAPSYDSVLFQFGGPKANRANITMLHAAKRLDRKGEDMERIRKLTGWHRWVDDKWRFEIDDSQSMLNRTSFHQTDDHFDRIAVHRVGPAATFANLPPRDKEYIESNYVHSLGFDGPLDKILDHTRLFSYYPQLRRINTDIQIHPDLQKTSAQITAGNPPDCNLVVRASNGRKAMEAIIHELQHAIQTIEGFAAGGSSSNYSNTASETKTFYQKQLGDLQAVFDLADTRNLPLIEASDTLGSLISANSSRLVSTHSAAQLKDYMHKLECELRPPRTRYLHLSGEYEARQTANRQDLSNTERMNTPIDAFEPVDITKLEVVFHDTGSKDTEFDYSESGPLGSVIRNPLDQRFLMLLSENYNPSTLLHESSHIFLDVFRHQALMPDSPDTIKEDFQNICDFLEGNRDVPFNRHQNEKWAIACETYFLNFEANNDKPPAISRMGELMKSTYGEAKDLGVKLTPEIKEVISRMFDEEETLHQLDFAEISELLNAQQTSNTAHTLKH